MSHGGIFGSDSDSDSDSDDQSQTPAVVVNKTTTKPSTTTSSSSVGVGVSNIFGSDSDSDSDSDDDNDLTGMSKLKPSSNASDRSNAVKKSAAAARRRKDAAANNKNQGGDSYDSESSDSENEGDKSFIDNNGVDKGELDETRFYDSKKYKDERPDWSKDRKGRKPKDALDEAMDRLKKPKNKTNLSEEQLQDQALKFVTKMSRAYTADQRAKRDGRPALSKIKMLKEVVDTLSKAGMRDRFLQNQVCNVVVNWLEVGKDGVSIFKSERCSAKCSL